MIFVCIASGPSLTQKQIDFVWKERKEGNIDSIIAVNDNWKWKSEESFVSDHIYAADEQWWVRYINEINESGIEAKKWVPLKKEFAKKHSLTFINCKMSVSGLGKNGVLHCGNHSGYQAINLAYHLGAKKIILIGYEMNQVGNKKHWFGDHPKGLRNTGYESYKSWMRNYDALAKDLIREGIEVINCSTNTAINAFKKDKLSTSVIHPNTTS